MTSQIHSMWQFILIATFLGLAGIADAAGFLHAGRVWQGERIIWLEAGKSTLSFQLGAVCFWLALRHLQRFGVMAAETQALIWFGVTIIGVAVLSGRFVNWRLTEQVVAGFVLLGIGWLMVRTQT
jgi:hypothetical protein